MQPITLTTTQIPKPAGVVVGGWRLGLMQGGENVREYTGAAPSTTFTDVPNGDYTIYAARIATNGNVIGTQITRSYTVADGETVEVPVSILVGGA